MKEKESLRNVGLAVLVAALAVGAFAALYFLSPAEAEVGHLSGLCEALMDQQIAHYQQAAFGEWRTYVVTENESEQDTLERLASYVDNPNGAGESFYAGEAARRLYVLEGC